jgi:hypothetical protein
MAALEGTISEGQQLPPPAESSSAGDDRQSLELRKLRAETIRAERELTHHSSESRLRTYGTLLSTITTALSVLGLLFTIREQGEQRERELQQRRSAAFADALGQAAEAESPSQRLLAVARLRQFVSDETHGHETLALLIARVNAEDDPLVREAITSAVLVRSSDDVLVLLADHNRATQRIIASQLAAAGMAVPRGTAQLIPVAVQSDAFDSLPAAVRQSYVNLQWSRDALVQAINERRVIQNVDLSHVVLSVPSVAPSDSAEYQRRMSQHESRSTTFAMADEAFTLWSFDMPKLAPGLRLKDVDLTAAYLSGLEFADDTLTNVRLDSAALAGTMFLRSIIDGRSSAAGFEVTSAALIDRGLHVGATPIVPAQWDSSRLDVQALHANVPDAYFSWIGRGADSLAWAFQLTGSTWNVRAPVSTKYPHVGTPARGHLSTFRAVVPWGERLKGTR